MTQPPIRRSRIPAPVENPFLAIPATEWIAANEHCFAIFDRFPVSDGHALIITRRPVETWFEATVEEQHAIVALISEVKTLLDSRHGPQGYNVGFNAGKAAGQTVMHLHVRIIPRYSRDMDDPSGGVRHVIPSKGNYRRTVSALSAGGLDDPFSRHVLPLFDTASEIAIVAAFIQDSGLTRIERYVHAAMRRGAEVRLITGDY